MTPSPSSWEGGGGVREHLNLTFPLQLRCNQRQIFFGALDLWGQPPQGAPMQGAMPAMPCLALAWRGERARARVYGERCCIQTLSHMH